MLAMAGVALCLSALFRLRVKKLRNIPIDLDATVFNQTFAFSIHTRHRRKSCIDS